MNDDQQQPYRPPIRSRTFYAALDNAKQEITEDIKRKDLFSMTINASTLHKGDSMDSQLSHNDEQQFLIDLVFKPTEPGLRLRPAETQLLLSYIGEILKEIEDEEKQCSETSGVTASINDASTSNGS